MPLKIYIKIGTHPAEHWYVCGEAKMPKVFDTIEIRPQLKIIGNQISVLVDDIKIINGQVLFFAARM